MTVLKKQVIAEKASMGDWSHITAPHGPASSDLWELHEQIALDRLVHQQPQMEAGNISVYIFFLSG